jgi:hypothetical protein
MTDMSPTGAALLGLTAKPPKMRWMPCNNQLSCALKCRPEANSEGEGNRVSFAHGITTHKRAVLPSLPRFDTAEHATEAIGTVA